MINVVGANIARRRCELGWTQKELAEKMGYKSHSSINKIELGVNDVTTTTIRAFAKALDVDVGYLLGLNDLTEKERKLVNAYRAKADMRKSVDMLLGI